MYTLLRGALSIKIMSKNRDSMYEFATVSFVINATIDDDIKIMK